MTLDLCRRSHKLKLRGKFWWTLLLAGCAAFSAPAHAQVQASGDQGGARITVGALASAEALDYGSRKMLGITGFADIDTHRRIGIEADARWLEFHQTANVHAETYSIGPRYHFDVGSRFEPYVKGLIGFGHFNYSYNLATGSYLVITAGGGLDYRLTRRIYWRAADFEYQDWPQFNVTSTSTAAMNTAAVSSGLRLRIF